MTESKSESAKKIPVSTPSEVASRMAQVVDHFYKGNKRAFAHAVEYNPGVVNYFLPGGSGRKGYPGFEVLNKVLNVHPEISAEWLIRGIGNMLDRKNDLLSQVSKKSDAERIKKLEEELITWQERFDKCQDNLNRALEKI